jgi:hypothetical protein
MKNPNWKGVARWHSFNKRDVQSHAILNALEEPKVKPLREQVFLHDKDRLLKEAEEALHQQEIERKERVNDELRKT